jgi:eukaryotic translation initiation factor 2C
MPHFFPQDLSLFRHWDVDTNPQLKFEIPSSLPQRPAKFNSFGKECALTLNTYNVIQNPSAIIYQYDVSLSF